MEVSVKGQYDVVIIGGGVTGLSAGLYTVRAKLNTILLERAIAGGQIINTDLVENYPGFADGIKGFELVMNLEAQASKFGLQFEYAEVESLDATKRPIVVHTAEGDYQAKAVIIATGGEHNKLGVPGEKEYEAKGVSYCATCDGNFYTNKEVVVVGGGDAAIDEGLYLTRMCKKVTVVHRRHELRASKILQERAFNQPKMTFVWDTVVESINGNSEVESLTLKSLKTGEVSKLPAAGVFVYIGYHPSTAFLKGMPLDGGGHVKVDINMATEVPGVFAAGDCRWHSVRQLASSTGDGVTAAINAYKYITEGM